MALIQYALSFRFSGPHERLLSFLPPALGLPGPMRYNGEKQGDEDHLFDDHDREGAITKAAAKEAHAPLDSQPLKRRRAKEPSQPEVAAWIAEQLGATGEETHSQILQAVRTVGRIQKRALCQKALQMKSEAGQEQQPAGDLFLQFIQTEGVPKRQPAVSVSVLARSIAEQLHETEAEPIRLIVRIGNLLGEEQAQRWEMQQERKETHATFTT